MTRNNPGEVQNIDLGRLRLAEGENILDLGSAAGAKSRSLRRFGYNCYGLEIDHALAAEFNRLAGESDAQPTLCVAVQGSATEVPFAGRSFQAVITTEVLEHIHDTERVLEEIHRVLAPGGALVVSVPTAATEKFLSRLHPRLLSNSGHVKIFEREELLALLRAHGFEIEHVVGKNAEYTAFWLLHSILRTPSDFTGMPHGNRLVTIGYWWIVYKVLRRVPFAARMKDLCNRLFPKSVYIYARHDGAGRQGVATP